eukprot:13151694-Alexandrium_andersonii.AAC.1
MDAGNESTDERCSALQTAERSFARAERSSSTRARRRFSAVRIKGPCEGWCATAASAAASSSPRVKRSPRVQRSRVA